MTVYEKFLINKEAFYYNKIPLLLEKSGIFKNVDNDLLVAVLVFKNLSEYFIKMVDVDFLAYDEKNELVANIKNIVYTDLKDDEKTFGNKQAINLYIKYLDHYEVIVNKVVTKNGLEYVNENHEVMQKLAFNTNPINKESAYLESYKVLLNREANYRYQHNLSLWQCSCGHLNLNSDEVCKNCGLERKTLASLTKQELVDTRNKLLLQQQEMARRALEIEEKKKQEEVKKQEEKLRLDKEINERKQIELDKNRLIEEERAKKLKLFDEASKKKKSLDAKPHRGLLIFLIIFSVALLIGLMSFYLLNTSEGKLLRAEVLYKEEQYEKSISLLEESDLTDLDAVKLMSNARLHLAKNYLASGEYELALKELNNVSIVNEDIASLTASLDQRVASYYINEEDEYQAFLILNKYVESPYLDKEVYADFSLLEAKKYLNKGDYVNAKDYLVIANNLVGIKKSDYDLVEEVYNEVFKEDKAFSDYAMLVTDIGNYHKMINSSLTNEEVKDIRTFIRMNNDSGNSLIFVKEKLDEVSLTSNLEVLNLIEEEVINLKNSGRTKEAITFLEETNLKDDPSFTSQFKDMVSSYLDELYASKEYALIQDLASKYEDLDDSRINKVLDAVALDLFNSNYENTIDKVSDNAKKIKYIKEHLHDLDLKTLKYLYDVGKDSYELYVQIFKDGVTISTEKEFGREYAKLNYIGDNPIFSKLFKEITINTYLLDDGTWSLYDTDSDSLDRLSENNKLYEIVKRNNDGFKMEILNMDGKVLDSKEWTWED